MLRKVILVGLISLLLTGGTINCGEKAPETSSPREDLGVTEGQTEERDETITSEKETPASTQVPEDLIKEVIDITVQELLESEEKYNKEEYLGKTFRITGRIWNIDFSSGVLNDYIYRGSVILGYTNGKGWRGHFYIVCLFPGNTVGQLKELLIKQKVVIQGELREWDKVAGPRLYNCRVSKK